MAMMMHMATNISRSRMMLTAPHVPLCCGCIRRLVEAGADIAIIGRNQATTDIPCHQHMKGLTTADGERAPRRLRALVVWALVTADDYEEE